MNGPFRLDRKLIRVSGPDAIGFLDNLLTQDVSKLGEARVRYAALLTPQGKVLTDMFLWSDGDDVVVDVDPARGADLMRRLYVYKLRAQVTLSAVEDVAAAWSSSAFDGARPDSRLSSLGWRKLADADALPDGAAAYDALRLTLGVPDLARDAAPDEVFAGEALLEELNGVDFQKGCFVGQENVSRMKRRATTRRKFCPIVFDGAAPAFGTPIHAGEPEIGSVRTSATGRAIALLRLDRAFAAVETGQNLTADGRPIRLDPPSWLITPEGDAPG